MFTNHEVLTQYSSFPSAKLYAMCYNFNGYAQKVAILTLCSRDIKDDNNGDYLRCMLRLPPRITNDTDDNFSRLMIKAPVGIIQSPYAAYEDRFSALLWLTKIRSITFDLTEIMQTIFRGCDESKSMRIGNLLMLGRVAPYIDSLLLDSFFKYPKTPIELVQYIQDMDYMNEEKSEYGKWIILHLLTCNLSEFDEQNLKLLLNVIKKRLTTFSPDYSFFEEVMARVYPYLPIAMKQELKTDLFKIARRVIVPFMTDEERDFIATKVAKVLIITKERCIPEKRLLNSTLEDLISIATYPMRQEIKSQLLEYLLHLFTLVDYSDLSQRHYIELAIEAICDLLPQKNLNMHLILKKSLQDGNYDKIHQVLRVIILSQDNHDLCSSITTSLRNCEHRTLYNNIEILKMLVLKLNQQQSHVICNVFLDIIFNAELYSFYRVEAGKALIAMLPNLEENQRRDVLKRFITLINKSQDLFSYHLPLLIATALAYIEKEFHSKILGYLIAYIADSSRYKAEIVELILPYITEMAHKDSLFEITKDTLANSRNAYHRREALRLASVLCPIISSDQQVVLLGKMVINLGHIEKSVRQIALEVLCRQVMIYTCAESFNIIEENIPKTLEGCLFELTVTMHDAALTNKVSESASPIASLA